MHMYICSADAKRAELLSGAPGLDKRQRTQFATWKFLSELEGGTWVLCGWWSTGADCLELLWSCLLWRYSKAEWKKSWASCSRCPCCIGHRKFKMNMLIPFYFTLLSHVFYIKKKKGQFRIFVVLACSKYTNSICQPTSGILLTYFKKFREGSPFSLLQSDR